jgi:hypothetical protein
MESFNENLIPDDAAIQTFSKNKQQKMFIPFIIKKRSDQRKKNISKFTRSFPSPIAKNIEKSIDYEVKQGSSKEDYFCIPYGEKNLEERIKFITDPHDKLFLSVFYTYRLLHKSYAPDQYVLDNKVVDYENKIIHDFTEKRKQFNDILTETGLSPDEDEASVMRKPFFTKNGDFEKAHEYFKKVKKIKDARKIFEEIKKIYNETVKILAPMFEQWVAKTLVFCIKHSAIIDDLIPNIKKYTFENGSLKEENEVILNSNSQTLEKIFKLKDLYDFFDDLVNEIKDSEKIKDFLKIFTNTNNDYRDYRYYVLENFQDYINSGNIKKVISNKNPSSSDPVAKPSKNLLSQEVLALEMESQITLVYLKEKTKVHFKLWEQQQDFAYKELKEEEVEKYFLINLHNKIQNLNSKFTGEFKEIFKDWRNPENYPMIFLRQIDVMDRYKSLKQLRQQILNLLGYKIIPPFLSLEQLKDIYEKIKKEKRLFPLFLTLLTEQKPAGSPPDSFAKSLKVFYPNALKYFMTDKTVFYAPPVIKSLGLEKNSNIDKIYSRINLYQNVFYIDNYGRDLVTKYYKEEPEKVYVIPDVRCYLVEKIMKSSVRIDYDSVSILVIDSDGKVKLSNGKKIKFFPNATDHYLSVISYIYTLFNKEITLNPDKETEKILEGEIKEKVHEIKELVKESSEKTSPEISKIIEKIQKLDGFDVEKIQEIFSEISFLSLTEEERERINVIYEILIETERTQDKLEIINLLFKVLKEILESTSKSPVVVEPKEKSGKTTKKKSKFEDPLKTLSKSIENFKESFSKLKETVNYKKGKDYLFFFDYILNKLEYMEGILKNVLLEGQKIGLEEKINNLFLVEPRSFPSEDLKSTFLILQSLTRTFPADKGDDDKIRSLKDIAKWINELTSEIKKKVEEKGATEDKTTDTTVEKPTEKKIETTISATTSAEKETKATTSTNKSTETSATAETTTGTKTETTTSATEEKMAEKPADTKTETKADTKTETKADTETNTSTNNS